MTYFPPLKKNKVEIDNLILMKLINSGTVSSVEMLAYEVMNKREKILKEHTKHRSIWQNTTTGKWHTKLGDDKHMIVRKERSDLENAIIEYYLCPPSASMTFEEVFVDYCKYCKAHNVVANKTVDNYESDYNKYIAPLPLVKYSITKVDEELLIKSLKTIVEQIKLDVKRYANVKTIIRRVFFHARTELNLNCITANNIISELKFPASCFIKREHNEERQIFKLREIQLIKKHLAGTEDLERLAILLVIETGLRLGEVVALKRCDIFKSYIRVSRSEHKEKADNGSIRYFWDLPKKKKIGNVNLTAEAIKLLDKIQSLSDSEFLFPDKNDPNTWNRSYNIDDAIRQVCTELNITVRSMQILRRTYASIMLQHEKLPIKTVQMQLRHSDEATTLRYYSYNIYDDDEMENTFLDISI